MRGDMKNLFFKSVLITILFCIQNSMTVGNSSLKNEYAITVPCQNKKEEKLVYFCKTTGISFPKEISIFKEFLMSCLADYFLTHDRAVFQDCSISHFELSLLHTLLSWLVSRQSTGKIGVNFNNNKTIYFERSILKSFLTAMTLLYGERFFERSSHAFLRQMGAISLTTLARILIELLPYNSVWNIGSKKN